MRGKRIRSVEGEMTKQEWAKPHIPIKSSKLWVRSAGPTVPQTLIEAGNDEVRISWTIILSVTVHSLKHTSDVVLEWNDICSTKSWALFATMILTLCKSRMLLVLWVSCLNKKLLLPCGCLHMEQLQTKWTR